jgi:hypothetical protein
LFVRDEMQICCDYNNKFFWLQISYPAYNNNLFSPLFWFVLTLHLFLFGITYKIVPTIIGFYSYSCSNLFVLTLYFVLFEMTYKLALAIIISCSGYSNILFVVVGVCVPSLFFSCSFFCVRVVVSWFRGGQRSLLLSCCAMINVKFCSVILVPPCCFGELASLHPLVERPWAGTTATLRRRARRTHLLVPCYCLHSVNQAGSLPSDAKKKTFLPTRLASCVTLPSARASGGTFTAWGTATCLCTLVSSDESSFSWHHGSG